MKIHKFVSTSAALIVLCVPAAFAQSPSTTTTTTTEANKPATVGQRKENQQDRIGQGVQSGQLTAGETKNLENKEAAINKETRAMRSKDDGHLTSADKARVNRQQNRLSRQIYNDQHNATPSHFGNNEVGQRGENQQDRIAQGIKSGQLTPRETSRLENKEQGVNREVRGMRQANGGKLSRADKRAVNRQQNKLSRGIYHKKHNARRQG